MKFKYWLQKERKTLVEEFTSEPPRKLLSNTLYILLGSLIMAIGESFFLIPMNIVSGGITSLALLTQVIPNLNRIAVDTYVIIINWLFFFIGLFTIGLKYSLKTLVLTITRPLLVKLFTFLIHTVQVDGNYILDLSKYIGDIQLSEGVEITGAGLFALAYFVAALLGGALEGIGIGYCYVGGGSSGGTDVICLLMNKYFHMRMGLASFIIDSLIIIAGFFSIHHFNLLPTLIGIISSFVCSFSIDKIFFGTNQYFLAQIISPKWKEINELINDGLGRGTTLVPAKGGYTEQDSMIIEACFDRKDYILIKENVHSIDPNAFIMFFSAKEVLGYGFSRTTPKVKPSDTEIDPEEAKRLLAKTNRKKKKNSY